MKDYLEPILEEKRKKLAQQGFNHSTERKLPAASSTLKQALEQGFSIIAEFKRASPSKGAINPDADPEKVSRLYEEAGADAVSVLTEETFFKGSLQDLEAVRKQIKLPILCKDFILDKRQIEEARLSGANIILLIVRALTDSELKELYDYAEHQGLEVLVEVHDEEELQRALGIKAAVIGINNRNLTTFEIDLSVTEQLAKSAKDSGAFVISESGITSLDDCERVLRAGADGILVGEAFMRQTNPNELITQMKKLRKRKSL
ncbi:indole-3-glycerol phosphate synthase TrpC [Peribacillus deserti]|uniref:Indole-3-glycerol phosphate synthase n=1 Tax=Peribacillus deserti TaxID=673318 RepID=A0A2N5M6H9_9BACI|nr:indole-3-glycerol phosphate synthase TrpC [Peribacillus deserti]PLT29932.1 indole-3-glycerol phosphate synthase TrpC [Peribacillus deserti]